MPDDDTDYAEALYPKIAHNNYKIQKVNIFHDKKACMLSPK